MAILNMNLYHTERTESFGSFATIVVTISRKARKQCCIQDAHIVHTPNGNIVVTIHVNIALIDLLHQSRYRNNGTLIKMAQPHLLTLHEIQIKNVGLSVIPATIISKR